MPVNTRHEEYVAKEQVWRDCRDAIEGERAVKQSQTAHLPKLGGQTDGEYMAYLKRALFYGASGRTLQGLTGLMFRKDPVFEAPNSVMDWTKKATQRGTDLDELARSICENVIAVGRHGVLLDLSQEEAVNPRPFAVGYSAESIINWRTTKEGAEEVLEMVVLEEPYEEIDTADGFVSESKLQWRVLKLLPRELAFERVAAEGETIVTEEGTDPVDALAAHHFGVRRFDEIPERVYVVQLWRREENSSRSEEFKLVDWVLPKIRGRTIDYIPFFFFNPKDGSPSTVIMPPLEPIVSVNLSHYRNSADLEHGQHFTALPTPWAAGFDVEKGAELKIGSTVAWVSSDPQATAGYLEFTGAGLGRLAETMTDKENLMAVLGARMLEEPKQSVEAADTHRTRKAGESATIADLAGVISQGMQTLLIRVAEWLGSVVTKDQITYEINKDYDLQRMDPQQLNALVLLLQSRKMSYSTFYWNLQRGEMVPEGMTFEEEMELIETEKPLPASETDNLDSEEEVDEEDQDDIEEEDDGD